MDVQAAIAQAKAYVSTIFGPEDASNIGLEEVEFDGKEGVWNVTIGFSRPWDNPQRSPLLAIPDRRTYKTVKIYDIDGRILAVKNRNVSATL